MPLFTATCPNQAVLRTAFELGRPAASGPAYGGVGIGTGDYALVAVLGVTDADPENASEEAKKKSQDQLFTAHSNGDWIDFVDELRAQADIRLFSENI